MRIEPVAPGSRPELADIERQILQERGRISALYQVLLNSAPLAQGWEALLTAIRNRARCPPAEGARHSAHRGAERGALRVRRSRAARAEGRRPEQAISALRSGGIPDTLPPLDRLVLELTDTMTGTSKCRMRCSSVSAQSSTTGSWSNWWRRLPHTTWCRVPRGAAHRH